MGAAGFFTLRQPAPWLHPDGALEATSFYETKLLKSTLERLVDFDRINAGDMRFSVGDPRVRRILGGGLPYTSTKTELKRRRLPKPARIAISVIGRLVSSRKNETFADRAGRTGQIGRQ